MSSMKQLRMTVAVTLAAALAGCAANVGELDTTTLSVGIGTGEASVKTLIPEVVMEIDSYDVSGQGPKGQEFHVSVPVSAPSVLIPSLHVGEWQVHADGVNVDDVVIACADGVAVLVSGEVTSLNLVVAPCVGTGQLGIVVSWPEETIWQPLMAGKVYSLLGTPADLVFAAAPDGLSAVCSQSLAAGYYLVTLALYDGEVKVWGAVSAARIIANHSVFAEIPLSSSLLHEAGRIHVSLGAELDNPVQIVFSGQQDYLPVGTNMTVTAATTPAVSGYQWYLDGELLEGQTGASIEIGSALTPETYRLDLVVSTDSLFSSETLQFTVVPFVEAFYDFSAGLAGWTVIHGGSTAADGSLVLYSSSGNRGLVRHDVGLVPSEGAPFMAEWDMEVTQYDGQAYFAWHCSGDTAGVDYKPATYLGVYMNGRSNTIALQHCVAGTMVADLLASSSFTSNVWNHMRVVDDGGRVTMWHDGVELLTYDYDANAMTSDGICVFARENGYNNGSARFDNVDLFVPAFP